VPRPTINDVARAAGVSKGAVSFAFNQRPGLSPDTRDRILATARSMGWTPDWRARALSVRRASAVGLVVARPPETLRADPFFPSFIAGVESVLAKNGYALLLQLVSGEENGHESYRRLAEDGRVDGVLLTDLHVDDERPALLAELGLPAVIVGPDAKNEYWPSVGIDDAPAVRAVVAHLVTLGHTRIAHVGGPDVLVHGRSRRVAWSSALASAGLHPGPFVEADFSAEGGATATRELLALSTPPTAIVYANDLMAMAGLAAAVRLGLTVPDQLSIAGFDDTELAAHLQPSLTTVTSDVIGWGRAAASRLIELIDERDPVELDLRSPCLVVRSSTGPAPAAPPAPG
jgi:DNA-binding LacI/PurR family transcriptional regulator